MKGLLKLQILKVYYFGGCAKDWYLFNLFFFSKEGNGFGSLHNLMDRPKLLIDKVVKLTVGRKTKDAPVPLVLAQGLLAHVDENFHQKAKVI